LFAFLLTMLIVSCGEKSVNHNKDITLEAFSELKTPLYVISPREVRKNISRILKQDSDSMTADYRTRSYYINGRPLLWVHRNGIDERADTLLSYISKVEDLGFSQDKFCVKQIKKDLERIKNLDVDSASNDINRVLARLEYNLTKAFLRYTSGQQFGFVNPRYLFNNLDVKDSDSVSVTYHELFDIDMKTAKGGFYEKAFRKIYSDSVSQFLHEVQPKDKLYDRFKKMLASDSVSVSQRPKILCNMERCRWRTASKPTDYKKYVLVNIPSFHLYAVDKDSTLSMRVVCGNFKTKTPLLTSEIKRMDINPQWIIPRSIIEKDIIRHVGNRNYFDSRHYFVRERRSNKKIPIWNVTWGMLNSKDYLVIQEGGRGNALGRIIFRFDNKFSVFLHDTSSPGAFSRDDRGASHGCVRVQKPYELATFLLKDKRRETVEKIKYSMSADVSMLGKTKEELQDIGAVDTLNHDMLISGLDVEPHVPVFITYFTMFPDKKGTIREYPDVYGYDKVIYKHLKNYR